MKKLMIAAAIVCAAMVSQAASVNWQVDWVYSNYDAVNTYDDGSVVNYWVVNMLGSTDTSGLSVDKDGNLVNKDAYAVVGSGIGTLGPDGGSSAEGAIANDNYLALVVYDVANGLYGVSDANQVSGIVADPPTAGSLAAAFQNDGGGYMAANTPIPTEPVPEPTSGLLMLLGVAGLALRRRRA